MSQQEKVASLEDQLNDWFWRLNNLYWILDKEGREVPFILNDEQIDFYENIHTLNVILKARQLGFSTFIAMFMLDSCLFEENVNCGIIDVTLPDAKRKLEKIKFAYDRLDPHIQAAVPIERASTQEIIWANGSTISVGTSHRGGTLQYLHISEFGKICATRPDKAREIITGALNTVQAGQFIAIESTAEGQEGRFYDICQTAQTLKRIGKTLTDLDFKFFFYPWWTRDEYKLYDDQVPITDEFKTYFNKLEGQIGQELSLEQKVWYVKKQEVQQDDMKREFPGTPEEAFEASVEGAIFGKQMEAAEFEGRIGRYPAIPGIPVNSFWDIGRRDYNSIWFAQIIMGPFIRVVGFYQNCMYGLPHYAEYCSNLYQEKGWEHGEDYFPHDIKVTEWGTDRTRIEMAISHGFNAVKAPTLDLQDGINAGRATIPICYFDEEGCGDGIRVLKSYRWEWDDIRGAWKTNVPRHDENSHGGDAWRTLGVSWREITPELDPGPRRDELVLSANRDGSITTNMSVREIIEAKARKKRRNR